MTCKRDDVEEGIEMLFILLPLAVHGHVDSLLSGEINLIIGFRGNQE
jgi:hypothetical protein